MSGRSAYVRKKITQAEKEKARARSNTGGIIGEYEDLTIPEFPLPQTGASLPVGTGIGTTNARFLKFSEPPRDIKPGTPSIGSGSGSSEGGRRDGSSGPLDDFAYARARRPTIKTEDVSGIEKSGLRSRLDKKSEDVRRGLAKTFTFKRKDKELDFRPESVATVRPGQHQNPAPMSPTELDYTYEQFNMDTMQQMHIQRQMHMQQQQQQQQQQQHQYHMQHMQHMNQQMRHQDMDLPTSPPPASKLPPVPTTPPIKRWIGAGRPVQRWNKLRKDPELWDPNGDVLVFFGHKGQAPRPNPSFRLSSHIIEATESRYLITLLREGTTEEDIYMPPSPQGAPPMLRPHMRGGQPTPPISEDLGEADGQISYEMYFPTPANMTKTEQLRSHITTRNVFALLYHASLVGLTLHQALSDLHMRLDAYMPPDADNVGMILNYLSARGIDDVRNDPETAVSLLAWSEGSAVRWEEGWRESFLHCAGMYSQLETCADFKDLTPITRALLERACLETQLRVQAAEERLVEFQYGDLWPAGVGGQAKAAADRLQKFFLNHYLHSQGAWPPAQTTGLPDSDGEDIWLTRSVAQSLQKDFGALYDYLVNRDIVWDMSEARSGRKWMMQSEKDKGFDADIDIPITDILVEFDNKLRFPHIPHPYPMVPESIPPAPSKESSMFKKKTGAGANNGGRAGALERRVQLAYTEATNIYILGSDFTQSDLIDAFVKFEKSDSVTEVDPAVARRGRWVLIYGILQTLASVSVDAPNVRYRDGVPYHLSPRLRGTRVPPWKGSSTTDEASHELSHCWIVQLSWNTPNNGGAESSGGSGNTSPVQNLARPFAYPRAPASTTSRGSGYQTTGTRSIHSTGSAPHFSSAYSVVSESDTASSIRTPASSRPGTNMKRAQSRDNVKGLGGGPGSMRSAATFGGTGAGGVERGEAMELPIRRRDLSAFLDNNGSHGNYARSSSASQHEQQSLPLPSNITGSGGFLAFDDTLDRKSARGGYSHGRVKREGSETDSMAPRIRDFDLDVIDDHEP
ncbi:uncharacterized protein CCOS01_14501 [Colletotrichum costaricense]|uniref:DUF8004 domain-containing protein n=1 Tax=Colletotrichum costaricense TaxID=1209916 RepID=A0AAI9YJ56_9PEZI|nr:uncharacterized protein CCOS01_14501 [Colletotrichum costaricense]KAK1512261.1 hypothetical protein CCOS01_14501 [Colletotrichum costaricense]